MANARTSTCNLALAAIGVGQTIMDATTEQSAEARICNIFWTPSKETFLRAYEWPIARSYKTLDLIETNPTTEWAYSYQYPNDCLYVRRILSGLRKDSVYSRVPYLIVQDSGRICIYSNYQNAVIEYTNKCESALFPSDMELAHSFLLASYIAPQLSKGDPFKVGQAAFQRYLIEVGRAIATASNEESTGLPQDTDSILARNGEGWDPRWR